MGDKFKIDMKRTFYDILSRAVGHNVSDTEYLVTPLCRDNQDASKNRSMALCTIITTPPHKSNIGVPDPYLAPAFARIVLAKQLSKKELKLLSQKLIRKEDVKLDKLRCNENYTIYGTITALDRPKNRFFYAIMHDISCEYSSKGNKAIVLTSPAVLNPFVIISETAFLALQGALLASGLLRQ
jgi:hypothetical protein